MTDAALRLRSVGGRLRVACYHHIIMEVH